MALEKSSWFKLSKFRLHEHEKRTVRPTGLDIISAPDAVAKTSICSRWQRYMRSEALWAKNRLHMYKNSKGRLKLRDKA